MERTKTTIETPVGKHKVEIFSFLIGRDKREIIQLSDQKQLFDVLIRMLVESVDGENDKAKVFEMVENFHGADYDFLMLELGKVTTASNYSEEKKS